MMTSPEFIMLSDGDIIGIRHIVAMLFVDTGEGEKRAEIVLSGGMKKKISADEGEHIRSSLINEALMMLA
jgi:hypothetical protein